MQKGSRRGRRKPRRRSTSGLKLLSDCCISSYSAAEQVLYMFPESNGCLHCTGVPTARPMVGEHCCCRLYSLVLVSHCFLAGRFFCLHPVSTEQDMPGWRSRYELVMVHHFLYGSFVGVLVFDHLSSPLLSSPRLSSPLLSSPLLSTPLLPMLLLK